MNSSEDSRDSFLKALGGRIGGFRDERLGELAVERGWITSDQLALCLEKIDRGSTHLALPELLEAEGLLRPEQLAELGAKLKLRDAAKAVESDPLPPDVKGLTFGKFILVEELGRGGMGIVYRAWQTDLRRWVAIKRLRAEAAASLARFSREGRLAAQVVHPHLIPIHEVGEIEGTPYLSMALIDGGSIEGQRLPIRRALEIMVDVAKAAQELHAAGICHRDIKPGNVMVDKAGRVFLGDFSLAWIDDGGVGLSKSGTMVGTPAYAPPEQILGARERLGPHSDVYAMGGTLYSLLTGEPPFNGRDSMEVARKALDEDPPALRTIRPEVASPIQAICMRAMRKKPEDRYPTAAEFAQDLQRYLNGETVMARPPSLGERLGLTLKRHRMAIAVGVAGVFVAIALFVIRSERREGLNLAMLYTQARDQVDRVYRPNLGNAAIKARTQALVDAYCKADPASARSRLLRMKLLMYDWKRTEADAVLAEALRLEPQNPEVLYWDARIRHMDLLLKSWARMDARRTWRFTLLPDPETDAAMKACAKNAAEALERVRACPDVQDYERSLMEGLLAAARGKWGEALPFLDRYLEMEPQDGIALQVRARGYFSTGDWTRALKDLSEGVRISPTPETYRLRAEAYLAHGDFKAAYEDLPQCNPREPTFLVFKGKILTELGKYPEAIAALTEAIDAGSDRCLPLSLRANVRRLRGNLDLALEDCNAALGLDGPHYLAWRQRAFIQTARREPEMAALDFEKAAEFEEGSERAETYSLIAVCRLEVARKSKEPSVKTGHLEAAIERCDRAIEGKCPFPLPYFVRGSARWELHHDGAAARADLERYLRDAPNGPYAATAAKVLTEIGEK